jgi:biopolymer transport protein ExbD
LSRLQPEKAHPQEPIAMMKRHRQPLEAQATINVTNLLDTAFILLVTFMLVTPQLAHSLKVKLPEVTKAATANPPPNKEPLLVIIQKKQANETEEHIYVKTSKAANEQQVDLNQLRDAATKAKEANPDVNVVIEGDTDSSLGIGVKILAVLREAQIDNIGLSVNIEKPKDKTPVR